MSKLRDGSIIPSGLNAVNASQTSRYEKSLYGNFSLREGVVIESYPPSHPKNKSGVQWEYDVEAKHFDDSSRVASYVTYYNCRTATLFGSMADYTSYTLRESESREIQTVEKGGSHVLLLCANGNAAHAYIIGSVPHTGDVASIEEHHFQFVFNGVNFFVNEAGEVVLSQTGPTDLQGATHKGKNIRTSIVLDRHGNISVSDGKGQEVSLENGIVTVRATNEVHLNAEKVSIGYENTQPVLRATPTYEASVHQLNTALKMLATDLKAFCSSVASEPMLGPSKAPASKMMATIQLLETAIDQYDKTVSKDDAISEKVFSE